MAGVQVEERWGHHVLLFGPGTSENKPCQEQRACFLSPTAGTNIPQVLWRIQAGSYVDAGFPLGPSLLTMVLGACREHGRSRCG